MAGTFVSQNKVRPGAYTVFKSAANAKLTTGTRGIVTLPMYLSWGDTENLIRVTAEDFVTGRLLKILGLNADAVAAIPLREIFKNAGTALVGRLNVGAVKASSKVTVGGKEFTLEAVHGGTFGNNIAVSCVQNTGMNVLELITTVAGVEVDRQVVTTLSSYVNNGWVNITSAEDDPAFAIFAGTTLGSEVAGTDGNATAADYDAYLDKCSAEIWNVMAIPSKDATLPVKVKTYIEGLRDAQGKKVQAVVFNYSEADHEGIISVDQGYKIGAEVVTAENFVAYVAGATAGALITESNTYKVIEGATEIVGVKSAAQIENGLQVGKLMLSMRQDRTIVIEKDINTLHTIPSDKSYAFTKNRVIRCLDDIATQVTAVFERGFIGKVNNDESGRTLFKGAVVGYLNDLQNQGAIQNFDSTTDVAVVAGADIESVVCELVVQPVDSMEKLYMTVVVY